MTAEGHATLAEYLDSLPAERRELHRTLVGTISARADTATRIQELLFIPGRRHPVWEDSEELFWQAAREMMLPEPAGADELPLVWIGYHAMNRVSRSRQAQGFLLTDRRVIAQDDMAVLMFGQSAPRQYPLFIGPAGIAGSAARVAESAADAYDWEDIEGLVEREGAAETAQLLVELVTVVLEAETRLGLELADEPAAATDLRGRLRELGLADQAKLPDDPKQAKHFAKLAKKMPLDPGEQVIVGLTVSVLIGGAFGLILTDRGVRSRDLMEDPEFTPFERVVPAEIRISPENKEQLIVGPGEVHQLTNLLDEKQTAAMVTLVREWAEGRLAD